MKIEQLHKHFLESTGICTDTRKITKGCLFFALKGDNFDGNKFAQQALDKGAYKVVIDDIRFHKNTGETILHGNSLKLLQKLSSFHRNYLGIPIICLTGSNGKTTTKELIHAVLNKKFNTVATLGNLNNHIGVPLTLLSMNSDTEIGVVEMGANHLKEIELLSSIAQPDYGYITNFGKAHLEGFGSLEGVIKGKSELYKYLKDHKKLAFVNNNDPKQVEIAASIDQYSFGKDSAQCPISLLNTTDKLVVGYDSLEIHTNLIGIYNFHNIAAAIAMGAYFNVPPLDIKEALERYIPQMNRSQILHQNDHEIILDAYNANPSSMMAALENFSHKETQHSTLILGDMFELGEGAAEEHQAIVDYVEHQNFDLTFLVGNHFYGTTTKSKNIHLFESFESFSKHLSTLKLEKSHILIKGSRGMALERSLEFL